MTARFIEHARTIDVMYVILNSSDIFLVSIMTPYYKFSVILTVTISGAILTNINMKF